MHVLQTERKANQQAPETVNEIAR